MSNALPPDTAKLLRLVCKALDEKKAEDLRILYVGDVSSITDYLVLATGTSDPHLRALRVELEKAIDSTGTRILGMDTGLESGWVVIDAFDVMVHVLTPENRRRYSIETLWGDAEAIAVDDVLNDKPIVPIKKPKTKAPAKKAVAKKAPKKSAKSPAKKKPAAKKVKVSGAAASLLRKAASKLSKKA